MKFNLNHRYLILTHGNGKSILQNYKIFIYLKQNLEALSKRNKLNCVHFKKNV